MAKTSLKITGLKKLQKNMREFKSFLRKGDKKIFQQIGKIGVDIIKNRTLSGKDVDGKKFKKYSKAYAEKKGSSHVDLKVDQKMLNAINFQAFPKKTRIYVKKTIHHRSKGKSSKLTNYNLAVVHNFGAKITHGKSYSQKHLTRKRKYLPVTKIPKREFMGFMRNEVKKLVVMIRVSIKKKQLEIFGK